jgi:hypothetical protein
MQRLFPDLSFAEQVRIPGLSPGEKAFAPVASLVPAAAGRPAPLAGLFALTGDLAARTDPGGVMTVGVDRIDRRWLADLKAVPGVTCVSAYPDDWLPSARLEVAPGAFVDLAVEAACDRHGVLLMHVMKGDEPAPDFGRPPVLEPMPRVEAARELIRKFRAGPRSAILRDEYGGDVGLMFLALVELLRNVRCFRLQVGQLAATAETVTEAMRADC